MMQTPLLLSAAIVAVFVRVTAVLAAQIGVNPLGAPCQLGTPGCYAPNELRSPWQLAPPLRPGECIGGDGMRGHRYGRTCLSDVEVRKLRATPAGRRVLLAVPKSGLPSTWAKKLDCPQSTTPWCP
jgi:hypothetical protein